MNDLAKKIKVAALRLASAAKNVPSDVEPAKADLYRLIDEVVQDLAAAQAKVERLESVARDIVTAHRALASPTHHIDGADVVARRNESIDILARTLSPDPPIANPTERAEAVAEELRGRGIWAYRVGTIVVRIDAPRSAVMREVDVNATRYRIMGPHAIADEIQREEAERAEKWSRGERGSAAVMRGGR